MDVFFSTDLHIGFRPKSNVTTASAAAYQQTVYENALEFSEFCAKSKASFILGDLFDKFSNSERIIAQGMDVVSPYSGVMTGNHDIKNIEGSVSSAQLLASTGKMFYTHGTEPQFVLYEVEDTDFYFCCHYYTQDLFEQAVNQAVEKAKAQGRKSVLMLHANVGDGYTGEVHGEDCTLFLTEALQKKVMSAFDLILVGHEHNKRVVTRKNAKGKIVILGNHFPLSFGEMVNKYVHTLDLATMELTEHLVWDASREYLELSASEVIGKDVEVPCQFAEIVGNIAPEQKPLLAKAITTIWKNSPRLLALRNKTEVIGETKKAGAQRTPDFVSYLKEELVKAGFESELQEIISANA